MKNYFIKPFAFGLGCLILAASCKKDNDKIIAAPKGEISMSEMVPDGINVELNPNGNTPLAAGLSFTSPYSTSVEIAVLGDIPVSEKFAAMATSHEVPVLGLYANTNNRVLVKVLTTEAFAIDTVMIQTDSLYYALPDIEIEKKTVGMEPGMSLCGLSLGENGSFRSHPIIFDGNGDIRWHLDLTAFPKLSWPIQRLANGNLYFGSEHTIYEYDMLGKELNRWELPGYEVHHEIMEMPGGNFLVAVSKHFTTIHNGTAVVNSVEDHIVEVDRASGNIVDEWDLRQILDVDRHDLTDGDGDWFHMNGMDYDETCDCIIVSGRNQGVVKINRQNQLVWILAPHKGWGKAGENGEGAPTAPYLLSALDASGNAYGNGVQEGNSPASDFDWTWGQHAPLLLENGNIMFFDNGFNRHFGTAASDYSRAVEYKVNEGNKTVKQVWSYGEQRGTETFSPIISDVDILPNTGNILFLPGIMFQAQPYAKVVEVAYPANNEVFEAKVNFKNALGSGAFLWGEFDIVYRSERLSLYP